MNIIISNSDKRPMYQQIVDQIKEKILLGELKKGEQLPSIRGLSQNLRISVITTKRAYDELENDGFIETVQGKGSFVAKKNQSNLKEEGLSQLLEEMTRLVYQAKLHGYSLEELVDMLKKIYLEVE